MLREEESEMQRGRCLAQSVRLADRLHRVDGARRARCELARALIDLVRRALQLREALIDNERDRAVTRSGRTWLSSCARSCLVFSSSELKLGFAGVGTSGPGREDAMPHDTQE